MVNVLVPLELSVMRKEYFNRWYSLSSYYISVTLVDLPVQVNTKHNKQYLKFKLINYYIS